MAFCIRLALSLQKNKKMRTAIRTKATTRRKLIDIPDDVFRTLSVKAAAMGLNLKNYIEKLLAEDANEIDDAEIYRYLSATCPEGKTMLNAHEKSDFENWLDSKRK